MSLADYTLGGAPIPANAGKVSTLGFDYTLGGAPVQWMTDGTGGGAVDQNITGDQATATTAAYDGTLTPGGVTISGNQATADATAYDGSITAGGVSITGDEATATATANDGSISATVTITGNQATATADAYDGSITAGAVTITGDPATASATANDGYIVADQSITGDEATATGTCYDGTISTITLYPSLSKGPPAKAKAQKTPKKDRVKWPKYEDPNEFTKEQQRKILEPPIVVEPQPIRLEPIQIEPRLVVPQAIHIIGLTARARARCYAGTVVGGWTRQEVRQRQIEQEIIDDDNEVFERLKELLNN